MKYEDVVAWMFSKLPMYQNKGKVAFKKDLTNIHLFSEYLNHPEKTFKSVHVAGTNGKGSTSHMLASILQESGYKVGLYTSPHLRDFRERIKINGNPVSKHYVVDFIQSNRDFLETNSLSFFEMTVGMAFKFFSHQNVDIAIVEVGLGGRLDSTNIIIPEVSVITNIGFDHTQFLGDSLEKIAAEKAGIIKENIPVIIGETNVGTKPVFQQIAYKNKAPISFTDEVYQMDYDSDLKGSYQSLNIKLAVKTILELNKKGFKIHEKGIVNGLRKVITNTGLKGRWQIIEKNPTIIADVAHNREGLVFTMNQIKTMDFHKLHIVLGVVNDKNLNTIIDLFPIEAQYYFCKPSVQRGLSEILLKEYFTQKGYRGEAYNSVNEGLENAKNCAQINDLIYVGGSTFVVAEII